jgi:hypothetical protein
MKDLALCYCSGGPPLSDDQINLAQSFRPKWKRGNFDINVGVHLTRKNPPHLPAGCKFITAHPTVTIMRHFAFPFCRVGDHVVDLLPQLRMLPHWRMLQSNILSPEHPRWSWLGPQGWCFRRRFTDGNAVPSHTSLRLRRAGDI